MKDHLIFDTTNASTIIDSDSVGAFVRGSDGDLITEHHIAESTFAQIVNQGLILKSKLAGAVGNAYTFKIQDSGGAGPISYTEVAGAIVVDLVGVTATPAQIVTLLSGSAYVNASAGTPTGNVVTTGITALPFSGGEDSNIHHHLDVYAALADGLGNPISSTGGSINVNMTNALAVDVNGIYNAGTNPTPDNVGIIGNTRGGSGLTGQTLQFTGGNVTTDNLSGTGVVAQDVNSFGMSWDSASSNWDRMTNDGSGNLNVNIKAMVDNELAVGLMVANTRTLLVANTAQNVAAAPLAARKYLWIYNYDNNKIFIGGAGVTAADGFPISPGSYVELRAGNAQVVSFVGSAGKLPEIRTLEQA